MYDMEALSPSLCILGQDLTQCDSSELREVLRSPLPSGRNTHQV